MKNWLRWFVFLSVAWCLPTSANALVTCQSFIVSGVNGIYDPAAATDLQRTGSITLSCTKDVADPASQYLYIGMTLGSAAAGRSMVRQTAPNTNATNRIQYALERNNTNNSSWRESAGRANTAAGQGGLLFLANFGAGNTYSGTFNYYFTVANGLNGKSAGIYDDTVLATLRESNVSGLESGRTIASTNFVVNVSILKFCHISSSPTDIALNYTSFSPTPVSSSTMIKLNCTATTGYSLALSPTSGGALGLTYSLSLDANTGTGTGFALTYTITATMPANQVGLCAAGSCTSVPQPHTLTITY